jgi:CheY-like chemotaxis protein
MPGIAGWEVVLRELKAEPATQDIPVIMVTMIDDRSVGYALRATEFLTKPVQRAPLVQWQAPAVLPAQLLYRPAHPYRSRTWLLVLLSTVTVICSPAGVSMMRVSPGLRVSDSQNHSVTV